MIDRACAIACGRRAAARAVLAGLLACAVFVLATPVARAADAERVRVTDPFLEIRTGPGRGYPIYFVAARDEWIEIEFRRTDWYKVRTAGGKQGWVHRSQLESTLAALGVRKTVRDVALDDYLLGRLELGGAWGTFKSEPMVKLWAGWRVSDTLSIEGTLAQLQSGLPDTAFWHVNLKSEPWSDRRWSPFFSIGVGRFRHIPESSRPGALPVNAKLTDASLGVRVMLNEHFAIRADYAIYTGYLGENRIRDYRAATIGLSIHF